MARLTCAYCGNVIRRSATRCPNCGAETESALRKFMEAREAETEQNKLLLDGLSKSRGKRVTSLVCAGIAFIALSILVFILLKATVAKIAAFAVLASAFVAYLALGIRDINSYDAESRELNARIDGLSHDIIFDCEDVQLYKMINDEETMDNDGCCREGLQQIAFKVSITNGSGRKVEFKLDDEFFARNDSLGYHVWLNADGAKMEGCKLVPFFDHHEESGKVFEPPLYAEGFQRVVLRPHQSIVGWVAFYVTPEAEDLELLFADDSVLVRNPARG